MDGRGFLQLWGSNGDTTQVLPPIWNPGSAPHGLEVLSGLWDQVPVLSLRDQSTVKGATRGESGHMARDRSVSWTGCQGDRHLWDWQSCKHACLLTAQAEAHSM